MRTDRNQIGVVIAILSAIAAGVRAQNPTLQATDLIDVDPLSDTAAWPVPLQAFVVLAQSAQRYNDGRHVWQLQHCESFDDASRRTWQVDAGSPLAEAELRAEPDGRQTTLFRTQGIEPGWIAVGQPLTGDVRIEMIARSSSVRPCDLSLFLGEQGQGPAFQFGGSYNTHNYLWVMPGLSSDEQDAPARQVDVSDAKRIERGKWHHVVLEVADRHVAGYVDGELVGRLPLGEGYDPATPRQPYIYLYGSTIVVDELTVHRRCVTESWNPRQRYAEAFGEVSRVQLAQRMHDLAALLDHPDWPVRDGAHRLLLLMGEFAGTALRSVGVDGSPEQQYRATQALRTIGLPIDTPFATAPVTSKVAVD